MSLSGSKQQFFAEGGRSADLFLDIAKAIIPELEKRFDVDFGKSVVHIKSENRTVRAYVHRGDRSKEYLTLVEDGEEFATFHYTADPQDVLQTIVDRLS